MEGLLMLRESRSLRRRSRRGVIILEPPEPTALKEEIRELRRSVRGLKECILRLENEGQICLELVFTLRMRIKQLNKKPRVDPGRNLPGTLPRHIVTELLELRGSVPVCSICQLSVDISQMEITSCGHDYCRSCLGKWLKKQKTCPACRTNLVNTLQ